MKHCKSIFLIFFILTCSFIKSNEKEVLSKKNLNELVEQTVVQIIAPIHKINIYEPYKTPTQNHSCGSGFFITINNKLYILTNAHVVDQAQGLYIFMPELGKQPIKASLVSIFHDKDIALLEIEDSTVSSIENSLQREIKSLTCGKSTGLVPSESLITAGYPLGQRNIKITAGVFCGPEKLEGHPEYFLQIDAAINPGSSGGPLLNEYGEVVGINTAIIADAQSVGYCIPIEQFIVNQSRMIHSKTVSRPFAGIVVYNASHMAEFLGNPTTGGVLVVEVFEGSPFEAAGLRAGDMIYQVNEHLVDSYGDIRVDESTSRLSFESYIYSINSLDEDMKIIAYRNGKKLELTLRLNEDYKLPIHEIRPGYDPIDYEIFAGMVLQPLLINHLDEIGKQLPSLQKYKFLANACEEALIVTHVFPSSELYYTFTINPGYILTHVNNKKVQTLAELRDAIKDTVKNPFITLRAIETYHGTTNNIQVALLTGEVLDQEYSLSEEHSYPISKSVGLLLQEYYANKV